MALDLFGPLVELVANVVVEFGGKRFRSAFTTGPFWRRALAFVLGLTCAFVIAIIIAMTLVVVGTVILGLVGGLAAYLGLWTP